MPASPGMVSATGVSHGTAPSLPFGAMKHNALMDFRQKFANFGNAAGSGILDWVRKVDSNVIQPVIGVSDSIASLAAAGSGIASAIDPKNEFSVSVDEVLTDYGRGRVAYERSKGAAEQELPQLGTKISISPQEWSQGGKGLRDRIKAAFGYLSDEEIEELMRREQNLPKSGAPEDFSASGATQTKTARGRKRRRRPKRRR